MSDNANDPWSAAAGTPAAANPYATADAAASPYQAAPPAPGGDAWLQGGTPAPGTDFLASAPVPAPAAGHGWSLSQLWDGSLPVQDGINQGLDWLVLHFRPLLHSLRGPVDALLGGVEAALQYPPTGVMIALLALLAWQLAGKALGLATLVSLAVVAVLGI